MLFRFTGTTGGSYYRAKEPLNNLVRGAYGLLANILGGAQGMLHPAWDEPFAIPTEESALLALRTQQILAHETGITKVADPLGGSYYIEALTKQFERKIEDEIERIEKWEELLRRLKMGSCKNRFQARRIVFLKEEKSGERPVIGINKFVKEKREGVKSEMKFHEADPLVRQLQIKRLNEVRNERNPGAVESCLNELKEKARKDENLMECLIKAVKAYASIGEIVEALKEVFGTFKEPLKI